MASALDGVSMTMYDDKLRFFGIGSSFDTKGMLDAQMEMLKLQNAPLENKRAYALEDKNYWLTLQQQLKSFTTATDALKNATASSKMVEMSADGYATITAKGSARNGNYQLAVQSLATFHKISSSPIGVVGQAMGYDATVQVNGKDLTLTPEMTLADMAKTLSEGDYGVNAVVIDNVLILNAKDTGVSNKILLADSTYGTNSASSSDAAVAEATLVGTPEPGDNTYQVQVNQLATSHEVSSSATNPNSNYNLTGSLTINGTTITMPASITVTELITTINNAGAGVTASLTADNRMVLKSNATGSSSEISLVDNTTLNNNGRKLTEEIGLTSAGAFVNTLVAPQDAIYEIDGVTKTSQTNTVSDIQGVSLTLKQVSGTPVTISTSGETSVFQSMGLLTSSNDYKNEIRAATDAVFTVDGVQKTSATNKAFDILPGVDIELKRVTTQPIDFSVKQDTATFKDKVKTFVDKYNETIMTLNAFTGKGAVLQGQTIPMKAKIEMNSNLTAKTASGLYLYQVGVSIDGIAKDGSLTYDAAKLDKMLEEKPEEVMKLLTGENSVIDLMFDRIHAMAKPEGTIDGTIAALDRQVTEIDKQLERVNENYEAQKEMLLKKYANFEMMMGTLNSQLDYITQSIKASSEQG